MPNIEKTANTQNFQWQKPIIIASIILTTISVAIIAIYFFGHCLPIDQIQHLLHNIHHIPYATSYIVGGSAGLSAAIPIAAMIHSVSSQKDDKKRKQTIPKTQQRKTTTKKTTETLPRKTIIEEIQKSFNFEELKKLPHENLNIAILLNDKAKLDATFERDKEHFIDDVCDFEEDETLKKLIKLSCTQSLCNHCITQLINKYLEEKNILIFTQLDKGNITKNNDETYKIKYVINIDYIQHQNNIIEMKPPIHFTAIFKIAKENSNWQINPPVFSMEKS